MNSYVAAALLSAEYDVETDGQTYASHPLLPGVTASGPSFSVCRQQFRHALEARLSRAIALGQTLPTIGGVAAPIVVASTPAPEHATSA